MVRSKRPQKEGLTMLTLTPESGMWLVRDVGALKTVSFQTLAERKEVDCGLCEAGADAGDVAGWVASDGGGRAGDVIVFEGGPSLFLQRPNLSQN